MAYCKVKQANLYYKEIGEGTPLLMIHGFMPDHWLMKGCMEPFLEKQEGWKRIYFDLPGMGITEDYQEIGDADGMLGAVLDLIEAILPGEDFAVVGESYGGYLARGVIERWPERVLGAAFICPVILPIHEQRNLGKTKIVTADEDFLQSLSAEERENFRNNQVILDEYNWKRYRDEVLAGCLMADEPFLETIEKNYALSFPVDQASFTKPSLFLLGREDSQVGYRDALTLTEKYPEGTFVVLDRAGHNLQIEQPQLFTALMREWIERVEHS